MKGETLLLSTSLLLIVSSSDSHSSCSSSDLQLTPASAATKTAQPCRHCLRPHHQHVPAPRLPVHLDTLGECVSQLGAVSDHLLEICSPDQTEKLESQLRVAHTPHTPHSVLQHLQLAPVPGPGPQLVPDQVEQNH